MYCLSAPVGSRRRCHVLQPELTERRSENGRKVRSGAVELRRQGLMFARALLAFLALLRRHVRCSYLLVAATVAPRLSQPFHPASLVGRIAPCGAFETSTSGVKAALAPLVTTSWHIWSLCRPVPHTQTAYVAVSLILLGHGTFAASACSRTPSSWLSPFTARCVYEEPLACAYV